MRKVKAEIQKLVDKYIDAEFKLTAALKNLKNGKRECDCAIPEHIGIIEGDLIIPYCKKCGGYVTI